jgi:hypothetical protein
MVLRKQPFDKIALRCAHKFPLAEIRECAKMICGWDTHTPLQTLSVDSSVHL